VTGQNPEAKILPASPCSMVIFGARGDPTKRLLMPALYNLAYSQLLPENFAVGMLRAAVFRSLRIA